MILEITGFTTQVSYLQVKKSEFDLDFDYHHNTNHFYYKPLLDKLS
jgi:hypothetical protein